MGEIPCHPLRSNRFGSRSLRERRASLRRPGGKNNKMFKTWKQAQSAGPTSRCGVYMIRCSKGTSMRILKIIILLYFLVCFVFATGCGTKSGLPVAKVLSWRTISRIEGTSGGEYVAKKGACFLIVKMRATSNKLYIEHNGSYVMKIADFSLSTSDGQVFEALGARNSPSRRFGGNQYRSFADDGETEFEVVFPMDERDATRSDLFVRYHDLPHVSLTAEKK